MITVIIVRATAIPVRRCFVPHVAASATLPPTKMVAAPIADHKPGNPASITRQVCWMKDRTAGMSTSGMQAEFRAFLCVLSGSEQRQTSALLTVSKIKVL